MLRSAACLLIAILLTGACADAGGDVPGYVVRDSAGITIVENASPAWRGENAWTIAPEPIVEIGMLDGPAEYQLDRVAKAMRAPNGEFAITNAGTEIRFYDADGRYLRTIGRQGDGPGEFQNVNAIFLTEDSVFAYDQRPDRLSVFDYSGGFLRSATIARPDGSSFPQISGRFDDGAFVGRLGKSYGPGGVTDGISRPPLNIVRYNADGELMDTIAGIPGFEAFVQTSDRGFTVTSPLFGRSPVVAVAPDLIAMGSNDAYEIGIYQADGTLVRLIRRSVEPRPVTSADWDAARAQRLEPLEGDWLPLIRSMIDEMPRPQTMPFYSGALIDDDGNLWVEDFRAPGDSDARWSVFDANGGWLGTLNLPEDFRPMQIGNDFIVGVWTDDLDVQYVRVYQLLRQ